ncbi:MAG TPA: S8 family serine peptidase [Povalibacter sp.]|uniref:S8 family peptidase n=1 Tax=Povalibacter sp. TaxID=1962978 RepID=UPI002C768599|nr:S8 family serine peptidase [Povalibacter sp.]HMN45210.1 S8 family serine peptidase [Povalibacter sp.]
MDHSVPGLRSVIAGTLLTTALAVVPLATQAAGEAKPRGAAPSLKLHGKSLDQPRKRVQVFVQLDQPAVAELNAQALETQGSFASPAAQRAQAERVSQQQVQMRSVLASHGAEILSTQRVAANGIRINVDPAELDSLRSLPGVRSVGRVEIHTLDNIDSVPWIGAPAVWAALGKGEGVKIGIIDTGIDYTHADFGGSGNPADYAGNNKSIVEPGTFPTAKVKGGYDFAGPTYNANIPTSVPQPDGDPLDGNGHGTHVAGTAAGLGVAGSVGAGVAPGAALYALKVFGDAGGSTDLTSLAIEWAMDPNGDGDMSDHLDVINMSLGSPFGEPDDPSAISTNNAAKVGIIVATSAGNEGNTPYVTGAPGVASSAISTAANTPGGRLSSRVNVTAPASVAGVKPSVEGAGPVTLASTGPITGQVVPAEPRQGCLPLTNAAALAGNIALFVRGAPTGFPGTCGFLAKYTQAQQAGARAIIVYNNAAGDPIVMGGLDATITIPGVMITQADGAALAAASNVNATIDLALNPLDDDQIAAFSSRGPGSGGSTFKPDLNAPGVAIVSAGVGSGTGSLNIQGTSMASPHTAGAAALLRQKHPKLDQAAIKALLQNSTVDANTSGDTDLARQGVGSIRVDKAVSLTSYALPGGVSFGRINPLITAFESEKVTLTDLSGKRRTFRATHEPNQTYPGVEVKCPSTVSVNAKGKTSAQITFKFDPKAAWKKGVYDDAVVSQTEVDGWCVFSDGKDSLRVGYLAVVDPASSVLVLPDNGLSDVKLRNFGPSLGWAEAFTLAKIGGERQNRTYGSIAAVGFRRANPAFYLGLGVLELGFVMERPFEHLSNLNFLLEIDADNDGVADAYLEGTDLSDYVDQDPGEFATLQFDATGGGFIDWAPIVTWDYNDRVLTLPFTLASSPQFPGLVPDKFSYVLTVTARNGDQDVQRGTVDLSKEIVPDLNSFGIDPNDSVDVGMSGPTGTSLWLLQNNISLAQPALSVHVEKKKGRK